MTTDITGLATVLRLAAESEIAYRAEGDTSDLWQDEASPYNILALVEALEKAQQLETKDAEMVIQISKRLAEAYKRIAELEESHAQVIHAREHYKALWRESLKESRTVTVKLPSLNPEMFNGDVMFGYRKAQKEAVEFCAAAGIKVEIE